MTPWWSVRPPAQRPGSWRTTAAAALLATAGCCCTVTAARAAAAGGSTGSAPDTLRMRPEAATEYRRGVDALAADDPRTAVTAFERALEHGYRPPGDAHLQLARAHREIPLHGFRALRAYRDAVREDPESLEAFYELADVWLELDGWDAQREARGVLLQILDRDHSYRDAWERWRSLYLDRDEAAALADRFESRLGRAFDEALAARVTELRLQLEDASGAARLLERWSAAVADPAPAWHHARGRLLLLRGDAPAATQSWLEGLEAARSPSDLDPWWEEVAPLVDLEELDAQLAAPLSEQVSFIRGFWEARDPLPFSAANERLAEQARRIGEVRRRYVWKKPYAKEKLLGGEIDDLGRPSFDTRLEGRSLDDRGTLYLRHGEPDQLFVEVGGAEYWRYRRPYAPGGRLQFHFKRMDGPMAAGNDAVYSILPTTEVGIANTRRGHEDSEGVENTLIGLTTDTWAFDYGERVFPISVGAATFRNPQDRWRTDVLLTFTVPLDSVATLTGGADSALTRRFKLYDSYYAEAITLADTLRLPAGEGAFASAVQVTADAGPHPWAGQLDMPHSLALGQARGDLDVPSYGERHLQLSDVLLAGVEPAGVAATAPIRGGFALHPLPAGAVDRARPLQLYYEVYDPAAGADGRLRYRVEYRVDAAAPVRRGLLQRIFGGGDERPDGRGVAVAFERERSSGAERLSEVISLDLAELPPGRYRLTVAVEDLVAAARAERSLEIELEDAE